MGTLQNQDKLRLGFLGGTFDPPHNGHLEIAKLAIEEANLSKLLLCPAFHAPLRDAKSHFSAEHRLGMVAEICKEYSQMEVFDREVKDGKTRYSHETIELVKALYPEYELFFILGADQFYRLTEWKNVSLLAQSVHFLVFAREAKKTKIPDIENLQYSFMHNELISVSSTQTRNHIHSKQQIPVGLLPPPVTNYINKHNLFSPDIISSL